MISTIPEAEWPSLDLDDANAADFFSQSDGLGLMISDNLTTGVEGSKTDLCNILSRFNSVSGKSRWTSIQTLSVSWHA